MIHFKSYLNIKNIMRFFLILIFGLFISHSTIAQLNIKSGYVYGRSNPKVYNALIDQLNANNSNLTGYDAMKPIKGFHGLLFGARYRMEPVALSLDVSIKFQSRDYEGNNPTTDNSEFRNDFFSIRTISPGVEFFINRVSFGGTIDLNTFKVRSENHIQSSRQTIYNDTKLSSHFFIGYNFHGSEAVSLALQPYIQIPWSKFDLTKIDTEYETGANLDDFEDGILNIGLRVIITNGYYEK